MAMSRLLLHLHVNFVLHLSEPAAQGRKARQSGLHGCWKRMPRLFLAVARAATAVHHSSTGTG